MFRVLLIAFLVLAVCASLYTRLRLVALGERLMRRRAKFEERKGTIRDAVHVMATFSIITVLHILETGIWAVFLFELVATRLLGGIEGLSGVLLSGLSTAFISRP